MSAKEPFSVDKAFLQDHALFGGFTNEDLAAVLPFLAEETFTAGECVVREGDTGDKLYFIEKGRVDVIKQVGSGEKIITKLGPGDAFGEMELIDIHPRSATVRATEPVAVLTLRNRDLFRLYEEHLEIFSRLLLNVAREISRRLRKMDEALS